MNWLFPAILAPLIYTITNFVDKYLVEKALKDYRGLPIFTGIAGFIAGWILHIINGFPILSPLDTILALLSGALLLYGLVFYFQALTQSPTSIVVILMKLIPVITLILSIVFLKQNLTPIQILGFIVILVSSLLISMEEDSKKLKFSSSFILMALSSALIALSYIVFAFVSESNSFSKTISFESWGTFLGAMLLYFFSKDIKKGFLISIKSVTPIGLLAIFLNEILFVAAKFFTFLAISLGPVALVAVLEGTQVFYAIILGYVLNLFFPKVFKEKVDRKNLIKRAIAAVSVFVGIILISSF